MFVYRLQDITQREVTREEGPASKSKPVIYTRSNAEFQLCELRNKSCSFVSLLPLMCRLLKEQWEPREHGQFCSLCG